MALLSRLQNNAVGRRGRLRLTALFALLPAVLFALSAIAPALAQAPAPAAAQIGPAGASAQPAVTPEEAQTALDVLQDAGKREALIQTLQTIAKAQAPQPSPTPTQAPLLRGGDPLAAPPATVGEGLGAEALLQASAKLEEISGQIAESVRKITKFPLFWLWLVNTARNPFAQDLVFGFLWRLATVAGLALTAEYLARLMLRRPVAALEAHAALRVNRAGPVDSRSEEGGARSQNLRLMRLWKPFARLPFAATRFLLEVAPVAAFAAAGNFLIATSLGADPVARIAILALINAYVICRTAMSLLRALAGSRAPEASLFIMPHETAAAIESWTRTILGVTVFGVALANVALALGLYRPAYYALVKLVVLVAHLLLVAATLRCRHVVAAFIRAPQGRRGFVAALRNRLAAVWHYPAIFANLALWLVWALKIQNGYSLIAYYALTTIVILATARAAAAAALGWLERALQAGDFVSRYPGAEAIARRYRSALRGAVSTVIWIVAAIALLEASGVDALAWFERGRFGASLVSAFSDIAIAIAVALVVWETSNGAMERQLARFAREGQSIRAARLRTLRPMLRTVLVLTILTIVGLTVLSEIGVNIAPLLAGAGIVGIAVGFGSQKLVQDVVTGLFLLLENAMQVGDFVTVSGLSGTVENLSIRTIRLRAADGSVHIVPFSSVTSVTNTNRGIGNAAISVNLAYDEDTDRASEVLKEIAAELRQDPEFGPMMRGDLALWGVDKVDGAMVSLVGQIECTVSGRWPVQREFNRRMKIRFQDLGIEIAHPALARLVADDFFSRRVRANGA